MPMRRSPEMKRRSPSSRDNGARLSLRQLRAGELVRQALARIVAREDLRDPELVNVPIIVGEVRASPDLRHMSVFVAPLGPGDPRRIAEALTRCAGFLRGRLARAVELRFIPELHFIADVSYDEARHIDELLHSAEVARGIAPSADGEGE